MKGVGSSCEVIRNVLNSDKWFNEDEKVEFFILLWGLWIARDKWVFENYSQTPEELVIISKKWRRGVYVSKIPIESKCTT